MSFLSASRFMAAATTVSMIAVSGGAAGAADAPAVLDSYADIALAGYSDSLTTAQTLEIAIDKLIAAPSEKALEAARSAWLAARVPYQQTEVFRFGNPIVDDWEGRVNAWPLDEGLIDYVSASYGTSSDENALYVVNVIANPNLTVNGEPVDATTITPALLAETLHEAETVEANVATGYHAIEFLLWGQDLNGTGPGAGTRPYTDFATDGCTGGHCDRRAAYLKAAATLLVSDLREMVGNWQKGGAARAALADNGLQRIVTGMGSLSYGELAGERMKLGLLVHDPEEEHDCFSDNTHNSHYYDALGIRNVYLGRYTRADGSAVGKAGLTDLVKVRNPALDKEMKAKLDATMAAMAALRARAEGGEAYDQMIGSGNAEGNAAVQAAIDALIDQTRTIERIVAALDLGQIEIEGSDSLDQPAAVFK
jgi:putative iron-regulated protein